jgi:hypothetical protein
VNTALGVVDSEIADMDTELRIVDSEIADRA